MKLCIKRLIRYSVFLFLCLCIIKCSTRVESAARQIINESIQTKVTSWDSFEVLEQMQIGDDMLYRVRIKYKVQNLYGAEAKQDKRIFFSLRDGEIGEIVFIVDA